jgi:uncharacterized protein YpmB
VASLWERWNGMSMTARAIILTVLIVVLISVVSYWTEFGSPFESQKEKDCKAALHQGGVPAGPAFDQAVKFCLSTQ